MSIAQPGACASADRSLAYLQEFHSSLKRESQMSTAPSRDVVATFYDANISGKLEGFVEGNPRVERAWETIDNWASANPHRILEIGCGIGDICWRMSRRWTASQVEGLDISRKSKETLGPPNNCLAISIDLRLISSPSTCDAGHLRLIRQQMSPIPQPISSMR